MRIPVVVAALVSLVVTGLGGAPSAMAAPLTARQIQQALAEVGCQPGPIDGSIGSITRSALIRFQAANGLPQSGKATAPTRDLLRTKTGVACHRRPVPARTGTGRRIVISQQQNWVWLIRANGTVRHQAGIVDNPDILSPGTYRTGSYCGRAARINPNSSASGYRLEHFVRFAPCGIGFHRIPQFPSSGRQMHANYFLGTNYDTSAGCIRVSALTARTIWDFTRPGSRVVVVGDR